MKEYIIYYNKRADWESYHHAEEIFKVGPAAQDDDGWLARGHYEDDDAARYAAYLKIEDVKKKWPDLNTYPHNEPRMYEREVGEWHKCP